MAPCCARAVRVMYTHRRQHLFATARVWPSLFLIIITLRLQPLSPPHLLLHWSFRLYPLLPLSLPPLCRPPSLPATFLRVLFLAHLLLLVHSLSLSTPPLLSLSHLTHPPPPIIPSLPLLPCPPPLHHPLPPHLPLLPPDLLQRRTTLMVPSAT